MLPLLLGDKSSEQRLSAREFYWEHLQFNRQTSLLRTDTMIQAARMGNWKAVRPKPGAPLELYDLARDPGETADVSAANPAIVARIEAYLKTARTEPRPHDTGSFEFRR